MKNNIVNIFLFFAIVCFFQSNAQKNYYKMPDGKIQDETYFKALQEGISENGNIKIELLDYITKSDSIIKEVQFSMINAENGVGFDPYAIHRKLIGSKFKIDSFKNDNDINYMSNYLDGKPTLINFWFTKCPPCVAEIPNLNNVESKFKDKVNFIAITFDTKVQVDAFLKKRNINFEHIVDAQKQLDDLQIEAYPMSFLLDKEGKIVEIYGEISHDENEMTKKIEEML